MLRAHVSITAGKAALERWGLCSFDSLASRPACDQFSVMTAVRLGFGRPRVTDPRPHQQVTESLVTHFQLSLAGGGDRISADGAAVECTLSLFPSPTLSQGGSSARSPRAPTRALRHGLCTCLVILRRASAACKLPSARETARHRGQRHRLGPRNTATTPPPPHPLLCNLPRQQPARTAAAL